MKNIKPGDMVISKGAWKNNDDYDDIGIVTLVERNGTFQAIWTIGFRDRGHYMISANCFTFIEG